MKRVGIFYSISSLKYITSTIFHKFMFFKRKNRKRLIIKIICDITVTEKFVYHVY